MNYYNQIFLVHYGVILKPYGPNILSFLGAFLSILKILFIFSRLKRLRRLSILLSSSSSSCWDYLQKPIIMSFLGFK